ncbi:hypothetical protein [Solimonas sp. K1W22B-7]|uniref:hypothetical protein n=1 Tax=Solimonas sp. K1W22B-7 TaxID=2303331 RepID=UPI0013C4E2D3|nr:hypothetical protein [Solimonas sp. K1W22B-7]
MRRERVRGAHPYSRERRRDSAAAPRDFERDRQGPVRAADTRFMEPAAAAEALARQRSSLESPSDKR